MDCHSLTGYATIFGERIVFNLTYFLIGISNLNRVKLFRKQLMEKDV